MGGPKLETVTVNGYVARVEFDEGCDAYFGCVINLSNPITFMVKEHADIAAGLEKAVRAYIEECEARGVAPEEPGPVQGGE